MLESARWNARGRSERCRQQRAVGSKISHSSQQTDLPVQPAHDYARPRKCGFSLGLINDIINPGEPAGIKEAVRLMDSVKKHCRKKNRRRLLMPYMSHPISRIFDVHMVFLQLPYMRLLCFDCQKF